MSSPAPPTLLAAVVASASIAGLVGYFLGLGASLGLFGARPSTTRARAPKTKTKKPSSSSDSESSSASEPDSPSALAAALLPDEECKLNLVVRTDLGMTKGKIAAQCSHATLLCYQTLASSSASAPLLKRWESHGQTKVVTQVGGEDELMALQAKARGLGLVARVVRDAGRTQVAPGSRTVLGVGPGPRSVVDAVTRGLKLL